MPFWHAQVAASALGDLASWISTHCSPSTSLFSAADLYRTHIDLLQSHERSVRSTWGLAKPVVPRTVDLPRGLRVIRWRKFVVVRPGDGPMYPTESKRYPRL